MVVAKNTLKYMLDTNICSFILDQRSINAFMKLTKHNKEEVCISTIVEAELLDGVENSTKKQENLRRLKGLLEVVQVLDFDEAAAVEYGKIKTALRRKGCPIGGNDVLIAAHARSLGLTLVTNNTREFRRVENLKLEDWS